MSSSRKRASSGPEPDARKRRHETRDIARATASKQERTPLDLRDTCCIPQKSELSVPEIPSIEPAGPLTPAPVHATLAPPSSPTGRSATSLPNVLPLHTVECHTQAASSAANVTETTLKTKREAIQADTGELLKVTESSGDDDSAYEPSTDKYERKRWYVSRSHRLSVRG